MIEHIATLICRQSLINEETNNISLIEVIEQINIDRALSLQKDQSLILRDFDLVTLWSRSNINEPSIGRSCITLTNPSGIIILRKEYDIDLSTKLRCNVIFKVVELEIQQEGNYQFHICLLNEDKAEWQNVSKVFLPINLS